MVTLQRIQEAFKEQAIDTYYLGATAEAPMAQIVLEIQTGEAESNHLEICVMPIPDSSVALLQLYVQLPLPPPFQPDDQIPSFLLPAIHQYMGTLNQLLPVPGFYCLEDQIQYKHIFAAADVAPEQLVYLVETATKLIQICQPSLQQVAIGGLSIDEAIAGIQALFADVDEEPSN